MGDRRTQPGTAPVGRDYRGSARLCGCRLRQTESMPTAPEVFVALRLRGAFDLRNVSDRIGLAASEIRVEGELVGTGRSGRRHKHSGLPRNDVRGGVLLGW